MVGRVGGDAEGEFGLEEAGGEGLFVRQGREAELGGTGAVVAGAGGHAAPGEGAPAVGVGAS